MKAKVFKEGDIVRIRQWDDMEEEFGTMLSGSIDCRCAFTQEMEKFCGREAELLTTATGRGIVKLRFLDGTEAGSWTFSTDMIEPVEDIIDVEPEELQPVTEEEAEMKKLLDELGGLF